MNDPEPPAASASQEGSTLTASTLTALRHPFSINIFSSASDAPRARRASDVTRLVLGLLLFAYSALRVDDTSRIETGIGDFVESLPSAFTSAGEVLYGLGALYALFLIGLAIFARGRKALVRDLLLGIVIVSVLGVAVGAWVGDRSWSEIVEAVWSTGLSSFPVLRVAFVIAVIGIAAPHLGRPVRRMGSFVSVLVVLGGLLLEVGEVTDLLGGVALAVIGVAVVHLLFGTPAGYPTVGRVRRSLAALGVSAHDVRVPDEQSWGLRRFFATDDQGRELLVKVYGRDAADLGFFGRLWHRMWYRGDGPDVLMSRLATVEHEALMTLLADRAGATVPLVVATGEAEAADALLVTAQPGGTPLADAPPEAVTDDALDEAWTEVGELHAAHVAHGNLNGSSVVLTDDGVALIELGSGTAGPDGADLAKDLAQLLVTTAVAVGPDRAVAAARRSLSTDEVVAALPLVQPAVLDPDLRHAVKRADVDLDELRTALAGQVDVDVPDVADLHRVSIGNVLMTAFTLFAVTALLSQLADIGFDTIVEEFSDAIWAWVIVAFFTAQCTNIGTTFSTMGSVTAPLAFVPTLVLQFGINFINLAVPSMAGRIAMIVRFLQKQGVSSVQAVASSGIDSAAGFVVQVLLFAAAFFAVGNTNALQIDTSDISIPWDLVGVVVALVVVGLVVVLAVPRWRQRILEPLGEAYALVRDVIRSPRQIGLLIGGNTLSQVLYAVTLGLSLLAYGDSLPLGPLILINTAVTLFAGLMPIPGGMGVSEAGLTAGMVAFGVPQETALAAALTHRMLTYYLPPIWGWFATRWLGRNAYL